MEKFPLAESVVLSANSAQFLVECWSEDACILDMDSFMHTLAVIKARGVRPDVIGSIITHYASKWLPELSGDVALDKGLKHLEESPSGSVTALWLKKRFIVETLLGILPPERGSIPCNFLLRLLRVASMVGVDPAYRTELEKWISWQLEEASLKELMIPSFCHTCGTLLDVQLVIRLVKRFVNLDEASRSGAASLIKVAKLVDSYLAEAALDSNLTLPDFIALAGALPDYARATNDGLYRAIDTYLKAHPHVPKHERKSLCRLIDFRKLSQDASFHAAQNERLPVRTVIQVMLSEQNKLNKHIDHWSSGSLNGLPKSPKAVGVEPMGGSMSKREALAQQIEIKKLKEDVVRLQKQCSVMQVQIERLQEKKKGFFRWRKFGMPSLKSIGLGEGSEDGYRRDSTAVGRQTPLDMKTKLMRGKASPKKWRKSM